VKLKSFIKTALIIALSLLSVVSFSQQTDSLKSKKHNFFFYWGYNRSAYSKSNITMKGDSYDYTLHKVVAHDRPSPFDPNIYFNPLWLSIPQFNVRVGYQLNEKWWISGGYDHMKYVVDEYQNTTISGTIDSSASQLYAGEYDNTPIVLDDQEFLHFEHTDGLNFITIDLDYVSNIWKSRNSKFNLEHRAGAGIGILYPRTDVTIFGKKNPNIFNLAGAGFSIKSQFRFNMWKFLFVQVSGKVGGITMPRITTSGYDGDYAKQSFLFAETFWVLGVRFGFGKQ
jgi:hypothetical protein